MGGGCGGQKQEREREGGKEGRKQAQLLRGVPQRARGMILVEASLLSLSRRCVGLLLGDNRLNTQAQAES
eukprot:542267-Rhodomonas_salina.1